LEIGKGTLSLSKRAAFDKLRLLFPIRLIDFKGAFMKVSVILGHPRLGSFNHAIAETAVQALQAGGHTVRYHDLYAEGFEPAVPGAEVSKGAQLAPAVGQHCDEIAEAEGIVVVHPNWWGMPPAILKGWIDRVLRVGVAYRFAEGDGGEGVPIGLLKAQAALVFTTSDTPRKRELAVFGDPLETIWKNCIFDFCGVKNFYRKNYETIVISSPEQRQAWLEDVRQTVQARLERS
jgi:NAD(P)H dehydrogenase (quinone)